MGKLEKLTNLVLNLEKDKEVTFYYNRKNIGTEESPDILITKCVFTRDVSLMGKHEYLVVNMYKEDNEAINEIEEIYRMPFIRDPKLLEGLIREVCIQSHSSMASCYE